MDRPTIHPQTHVVHVEQEADVDEKLAPLILALWRAGFDTVRSCQRHATGKVWVEFLYPQDVERFLNSVAPHDKRPRSLWRRVNDWAFGQYEPTAGPVAGGDWEYHVTVTDSSHDNAADVFVQRDPAFALSVSVLFPRRDLVRVTERVRMLEARPAPTTLFHRTTREAADAILRDGFRDSIDTYMTGTEHSGVWVADEPLDANEGAAGEVVLRIELPPERAAALAKWEWREKMKRYREWLVPASFLNSLATVSVEEVDEEPPAWVSEIVERERQRKRRPLERG